MNGIKRTAQYCRQWGKKALELRRCWIVRLLANQLFRGRVILGYRNFTGGIKLFWKSKNRVETWSHLVTFILKCHCQVANFVTAGGVNKKLQYRPKGVLLSNLILHCFIKFNKVGKVWATIEFRHVCNNFCPLASMGKVWQRGKSRWSFSQSGFSLSLPQRTAQYNGSGKRNSYPSLSKIQNGWKI